MPATTMIETAPAPAQGLPPQMPRICLALQAPTVAELLAKAEQAARESVIIELRLDYLNHPETAPARIRQFCESNPDTPLIATCRRQAAGGKFKGTIAAELALLAKAAQAGCRFVDVSLETAERAGKEAMAGLGKRARLILSYHDFERMRDPEPIFTRMQKLKPAVYKLVFTARSFSDNLVLDAFLQKHAGRMPVVGLCMGEWGVPSRLLCMRDEAAFTFASYGAGEETAPGQIDIRELRQVYRVDDINRATRVYGVLGYPIKHSLSPRMLNAAFRKESLNAVYLPLAAKKAEEVLAAAHTIPLSGLSVTIPHKTAVASRLDGLDPLAKKIGAVNTIVRSNGKLYGYNTDVAGIVGPLEQRLTPGGTPPRVLVLGAGGAARAAVFGLRARGAEVSILNRTSARALALAKQAQAKTVKRADLKKLPFDVIINATPVGMWPDVKQSPLKADEIRAAIVFDLIYNPMQTELLRMAQAAGAQVISGMEMFIAQGARQFQIWTGKPAPVAEMRHAVVSWLEEEEKKQKK